MQDTWAKVGDRRDRPGYLAAIVRSLAGRRRRAEDRRARREQQAAAREALPSAADIAARSELARALAAAVARLDEPYRSVVVLHYYDDLSSADIARRSGVPAATVRARLRRGLELLRMRLDADGGGRERWLGALLAWVRLDAHSAVAIGTPLTAVLAMKTTLLSLLAVAALALGWLAIVRPDSAPADAARVADTTVAPPPASVAGDPGAEAARQALATVSTEAPAPGAAIAVIDARAIDGRRRPLANAWLTLAEAPTGAGASATAAADGVLRFAAPAQDLERLAALDGERFVHALVGAPGHQTRRVRAALPPGRIELNYGDVLLEPGGDVSGRVVDEHGAGVAGALVAFGGVTDAAVDDGDAADLGPRDLYVEARENRDPAIVTHSGPGGEFALVGVPTGYGTAWARAPEGRWTHSEPIGVRACEQVDGVVLVVRRDGAATVTGSVVDPDGRPVPDIDVRFPTKGGWNSVHTDAGGGFHFVARQEGPLAILVMPPRDDWEAIERDGIAPGTHGLVLAFAPVDCLRVTACDADGRPLTNGTVTGLRAAGSTQYSLSRCESTLDAAGTARLRRSALPLRIRVAVPGYRDRVVGPFEPATVPDPIAVVLERVPALVGRVVTEDGAPAAGAVVTLHRAAGERVGTVPPGGARAALPYLTHQSWSGDREPFVYALGVEPRARATADADGRFRLPLPGVDATAEGEVELGRSPAMFGGRNSHTTLAGDARWYLHAVLDGHATATTGPHEFDPARDAEVLLELPRAGAIAGRLELAAGVSPAGWTMFACDALAELAEAPVRADGSFAFAQLHPGDWQVRAFEPGALRPVLGGRMVTDREPVADVHVVAGQTARWLHDGQLRQGARLFGRVRIDGAPPGPATVCVQTSTEVSAFTSYLRTLDPDGRFELQLQPGLATQIRIALTGSSIAVIARPVIVPGANEWAVEFATATVTGTWPAQDASKVPWRDRLVFATQLRLAQVEVAWPIGTGGPFGPFRVAAGHLVVRGPRPRIDEPAPVLVEVDVAKGEAVDLGQLPR